MAKLEAQDIIEVLEFYNDTERYILSVTVRNDPEPQKSEERIHITWSDEKGHRYTDTYAFSMSMGWHVVGSVFLAHIG
jgi:hypothetical protein|tara:strand:- start:206 stop:439 length:234 start_codon:yes stop_codon:yes gene_type:complete